MEEKIFASKTFFTAGGKIDTTSTEPLSVVFIGGSLTSGDIDYEGTELTDWNMKWPNTVLRFLAGLFPSRKISAYNAGVGGTGSQYGALRFQRDVLAHNPDLVFIEFSVNDCPPKADLEREHVLHRQMYMESMIRQCMEAPKVPVIIYSHLPYPVKPTDELYFNHKKSIEVKEEILDYYGIHAINVMEDILAEYEARKAENPSLTYDEFYLGYYRQCEDGHFDVHPHAWGYKLFNMSIVNAIMKNPEKYFAPFKMKSDVYCKGHEYEVFERSNYVPACSDRFTYNGDWTLYTKENPFVTEEGDRNISIGNSRYDKIDFPLGIMQTYMPKEGTSFEFDTEADRFCMPHPSARWGLEANVYADGALVRKIGCRSIYHSMNYTSSTIELPKGKKHIKIVIDPVAEEQVIFRFGYIVEMFDKRPEELK